MYVYVCRISCLVGVSENQLIRLIIFQIYMIQTNIIIYVSKWKQALQ